MRFDDYYFIENKDSFIKKMPNLSDEEKEELMDFFHKKVNMENKIDWNKWKTLTYDDFKSVMNPDTFTQLRKSVKEKGISGLKEGKDYLNFPLKNYKAYIPLTYKASKLIASNRIGGCNGRWCTAQQKSSDYWEDYVINENVVLIYIVTKDTKYAVAIYPNNDYYEIFNANDNSISELDLEKEELIKFDKEILSQVTLFDKARDIIKGNVDSAIIYGNDVVDINGNIYKTIMLNGQEWMIDDLKVTKYNDGTSIPIVEDDDEWRNLKTPAMCYSNNDKTQNILYNWYAVDTGKLAPKGWHVASIDEWRSIKSFIKKDLFYTSLDGYWRRGTGEFDYEEGGSWWTSTAFDDDTTARLYGGSSNEEIDEYQGGHGVRCVKD